MAYIDTNILGNWILYYKNQDAVKKAGKRVIESFDMLNEIKNDNLVGIFISSTWAICELAGLILDSILADKMVENGISLRQFSSQRRVFEIKDETLKRTIIENIADFQGFLKDLDIEAVNFEVDYDSVIDLIMKHTFLSTPDALHLSFAIGSCDVLATLDERHFLDSKHRKQNQDLNEIEILRPSELVRRFRKKSQ